VLGTSSIVGYAALLGAMNSPLQGRRVGNIVNRWVGSDFGQDRLVRVLPGVMDGAVLWWRARDVADSASGSKRNFGGSVLVVC
jgi:hypothetical protein